MVVDKSIEVGQVNVGDQVLYLSDFLTLIKVLLLPKEGVHS